MSAISSENRLPPWTSLPISKQLRGDMRSNHAGETGAVCIYRGILRITRDPGVARFAKDHLATEERHLSIFEAWLPKQHRSCLLPLWRLAGYLLGMIAAWLGPRWVFTTIDAVENFVVAHYEEQILRLSPLGGPARLLADALNTFRADEAAHREEASNQNAGTPHSRVERIWYNVVGIGSSLAVSAARAV